MTPRLSVITICRNALPALQRTVESVLSQRTSDLEYWVVDGASTDGTRAYLETLTARGVRVLSEPDRGIADAMNKGARLASGEWIAHLHADDEYLPGALTTVSGAMSGSTADVLSGWMIQREPHGEVLCRSLPERLPIEMAVPHPSTFTRRALFERLGGFDPALRNAMDYDFFLRALVAGARFEVVPQPLTRMAYGGQSERSLWRTLRETHAIRRRRLTRGISRSGLFLMFLFVKGSVRKLLQRLGLDGLVGWYRRTWSIPRKG